MISFKNLSLSLCTVAGTAAFVLALPREPRAGRIAISGSTTVYPVVSRASDLFGKEHPEITFAVGQGGSGAGVGAAGKGEVAIGMASRELKDAEKKDYPELVTTRIGTDAIVIIVNAGNSVADLNLDQLAALYTGKVQNWKDVGGADAPVVLISSDKVHGTTEGFAEHLKLDCKQDGAEGKARIFFAPKGSEAWSEVSAQVVKSPKDALASVMVQPNAISFTPLPLASDVVAKGGKLKILSVGGVLPAPKSIRDNTYAICRPLMLVTKGAPQGDAASFVQYLLGAEGQKLVAAAGYVPN